MLDFFISYKKYEKFKKIWTHFTLNVLYYKHEKNDR